MMHTAQPIQAYEVYPGCTAERFGRWFLEHNPIKLERICMHDGIDFDALPGLVDAVLDEWAFRNERHRDEQQALGHMMNHLRKKNTYARQDNSQWRRGYQPSRQDAGRVAEDLEVAQAILRRINPGKG